MDDARLFLCARCQRQVRVCSRCDRGQQYCGARCSGLDGGGFEQGELAAGQTQAVGEVGVEFVAVESIEVATPAGWASWTTSMGREGGASGSYRKVTGLAKEHGIDLVESSVEADGAVFHDTAFGLEEEEVVEVCGGVGVARDEQSAPERDPDARDARAQSDRKAARGSHR